MVNQSVCSLMQAAKTKRSHSSYLQELEHASSPLSARAWLGVVRERQEEWRKSHTPWRYGHHGDTVTMVMTRRIISEAVSWSGNFFQLTC